MNIVRPFLLLVLTTAVACGGTSGVASGSGCDWIGDEYGFNQVHTCTEFDSHATQTQISALQTSCLNGGGKWVTECGHSSASCEFISSDTPVPLTDWYLSLGNQDAMSICMEKSGTFMTH